MSCELQFHGFPPWVADSESRTLCFEGRTVTPAFGTFRPVALFGACRSMRGAIVSGDNDAEIRCAECLLAVENRDAKHPPSLITDPMSATNACCHASMLGRLVQRLTGSVW